MSIFFCAYLLKRKRRTVESGETKERVTFVSSDSLVVFLCRCRRKEKLSKETPLRETRKRGLFEKSPLLNSPKNFYTAHAKHWVCVPKAARQPFSPRQRRYPQGGAGMSGERSRNGAPCVTLPLFRGVLRRNIHRGYGHGCGGTPQTFSRAPARRSRHRNRLIRFHNTPTQATSARRHHMPPR